MPSVHVAWAAAVALVVVVVARTRWRWLAVGYPLVTMWVVIVTGNHFTIDGIAAIGILAAAATACLWPSQRPSRAID
jgi:membrane-associated phospholipid phosphatase